MFPVGWAGSILGNKTLRLCFFVTTGLAHFPPQSSQNTDKITLSSKDWPTASRAVDPAGWTTILGDSQDVIRTVFQAGVTK